MGSGKALFFREEVLYQLFNYLLYAAILFDGPDLESLERFGLKAKRGVLSLVLFFAAFVCHGLRLLNWGHDVTTSCCQVSRFE